MGLFGITTEGIGELGSTRKYQVWFGLNVVYSIIAYLYLGSDKVQKQQEDYQDKKEILHACCAETMTPTQIDNNCDPVLVGMKKSRAERWSYNEYIELVPESCRTLFKEAYDILSDPEIFAGPVTVILFITWLAFFFSFFSGAIRLGFDKGDDKVIDEAKKEDLERLGEKREAELNRFKEMFKHAGNENEKRMKEAMQQTIMGYYDEIEKSKKKKWENVRQNQRALRDEL